MKAGSFIAFHAVRSILQQGVQDQAARRPAAHARRGGRQPDEPRHHRAGRAAGRMRADRRARRAGRRLRDRAQGGGPVRAAGGGASARMPGGAFEAGASRGERAGAADPAGSTTWWTFRAGSP